MHDNAVFSRQTSQLRTGKATALCLVIMIPAPDACRQVNKSICTRASVRAWLPSPATLHAYRLVIHGRNLDILDPLGSACVLLLSHRALPTTMTSLYCLTLYTFALPSSHPSS